MSNKDLGSVLFVNDMIDDHSTLLFLKIAMHHTYLSRSLALIIKIRKYGFSCFRGLFPHFPLCLFSLYSLAQRERLGVSVFKSAKRQCPKMPEA